MTPRSIAAGYTQSQKMAKSAQARISHYFRIENPPLEFSVMVWKLDLGTKAVLAQRSITYVGMRLELIKAHNLNKAIVSEEHEFPKYLYQTTLPVSARKGTVERAIVWTSGSGPGQERPLVFFGRAMNCSLYDNTHTMRLCSYKAFRGHCRGRPT